MNPSVKTGITSGFQRFCFSGIISQLNRLSTQLGKENGGKTIAPRQLRNTSFGMICPSETPEGKYYTNIYLYTYIIYCI